MKIYKPKDLNEYKDILDKHNYILVQFSASWCGPCRKITPEIMQYINKFDNNDNAYVYCDIDNSYASQIAKKQNINSIPTFVIYSKNKSEYLKTITTCELDNLVKYCKENNLIDE